MEVSGLGSWNGIERRKKDRRGEDVKKCFRCQVNFPRRGLINMCPDCVNEMILRYKKDSYLDIHF